MKILIIDNYDSFSYNLLHMVEEITGEISDILRNDEIDLNSPLNFDKVILSPGPGLPSESGLLMEFIKKFHAEIPMLGVCLGQQAIAEVFGGKLRQLQKVHHGISTQLHEINDDVLFKNCCIPFQVGRYHSWVVDEADFPPELEITSRDENGIIMSLKHRKLPISAVQFHPESVLTPQGKTLLSNWIFN